MSEDTDNTVSVVKEKIPIKVSSPERYSSSLLEPLEEEVKELEAERDRAMEALQKENEAIVSEETEELTAEDQTWKDRYSNLRRHNQSKADEYKQTVSDLKAELDSARSSNQELPSTEEEVRTFIDKYPDVYKMMESIAMSKDTESKIELERKQQELSDRLKDIDQRDKKIQLKEHHPDIERINSSPIFKDWVLVQPEDFKRTLFERSDPDAAARIIDLFKKDVGWKSKSAVEKDTGVRKTTSDTAAASQVRTAHSQAAPTQTTKRVFRETEIEAMSADEFEKNEEDITLAQREGRILLDKTNPFAAHQAAAVV